ncbi:LPS export ABC transporter periplasmic protein LptC, partial [Salmonella enterica subsp. enterica]|nr:LPS export ABC transporter periplasmic protein LptC [Salmonella enterica subsp. enterica]
QENSMSTDQPVKIENSSASIVADSMKITQSGKVMVFEKGVRLVIQPAKLHEGRNEAKSPQ